MFAKILLGIVIILFAFGSGKLYIKDAATVKQAHSVEKYLTNYCLDHYKYPEPSDVEKAFPHLYPNKEWFYWPNEHRTFAKFQYPMTLLLLSAPGRSKVPEFFPIIYSYVVDHPCKAILE